MIGRMKIHGGSVVNAESWFWNITTLVVWFFSKPVLIYIINNKLIIMLLYSLLFCKSRLLMHNNPQQAWTSNNQYPQEDVGRPRYLRRKTIFEERAATIAEQNARGTWKAGAGLARQACMIRLIALNFLQARVQATSMGGDPVVNNPSILEGHQLLGCFMLHVAKLIVFKHKPAAWV